MGRDDGRPVGLREGRGEGLAVGLKVGRGVGREVGLVGARVYSVGVVVG